MTKIARLVSTDGTSRLIGPQGLMIGRGAIADPLIFERIRGNAPAQPSGRARQREISTHLQHLLDFYRDMFCGEAQVLAKFKETARHIDDPNLGNWLKKLRRVHRVDALTGLLAEAHY